MRRAAIFLLLVLAVSAAAGLAVGLLVPIGQHPGFLVWESCVGEVPLDLDTLPRRTFGQPQTLFILTVDLDEVAAQVWLPSTLAPGSVLTFKHNPTGGLTHLRQSIKIRGPGGTDVLIDGDAGIEGETLRYYEWVTLVYAGEAKGWHRLTMNSVAREIPFP